MTTQNLSERSIASRVSLPELHATSPEDNTARPMLDLLDDINVSVDIRLGRSTMTVKEMMALHAGAVIGLEQSVGDLVDVLLNDKTIAQGEIVAIDGRFGVRITSITPAQQ